VSPLDVAPMLADFNVGPLTATRYAAGSVNTYGEHVPGATSPVVLDPVAAYPTDKRTLEWAPEALRAKDWTTFITDVEIKADEAGALSDVIAYSGRSWRVLRLKDMGQQGAVWIADACAEDATA